MGTFNYGGQAVIEGVMMRGRAQATVVMRSGDGTLISHSEALPSFIHRSRIARLPLARGLVVLWEMMILGTRLMLVSADVQARGELGRSIPKGLLAGIMAFSMTFAIGLFFVLPLVVTSASAGWLRGGVASSLFEGTVRLSIFLLYLGLIGRLGQMSRVFQYHGAEHKTINAYEAGASLTPGSVQRYSTLHIRCGTAFLLWVLVISIFVFALIGHPPLLLGVVMRLALVPVIAALGYEVLQLAVRYRHLHPVRIVLQPSLWLQRLTTRQPTDEQVEVAIAALLPVLIADGIEMSSQHSPSASTGLKVAATGSAS